MKKLNALFILILLSTMAYGQNWQNVSNSLQRKIVGADTLYRFNMGAPGFWNISDKFGQYYTKVQSDARYALAGAAGVSSFNGRTGAITPLVGDYSGFYPVLTGSYVNPSWITSLPWSKITSTPTTLSGYGITDGVTLNTFQTITAAKTFTGVVSMNGIRLLGASTAFLEQEAVSILPVSTRYSTFWDSDGNYAFNKTGQNSNQSKFSFNPTATRTYTWPDASGEVVLNTSLSGYVPTTRTVAGFALSSNVTLGTHTAGYGLSGGTYNGSGAITWTADTTSATGLVSKDRLNTALASKVTANTSITGATKAKITYDSKGLVTAGADLTESDIPSLSISKVTGLGDSLNNVVKLTGDQTVSGEKTFVDTLKIGNTGRANRPLSIVNLGGLAGQKNDIPASLMKVTYDLFLLQNLIAHMRDSTGLYYTTADNTIASNFIELGQEGQMFGVMPAQATDSIGVATAWEMMSLRSNGVRTSLVGGNFPIDTLYLPIGVVPGSLPKRWNQHMVGEYMENRDNDPLGWTGFHDQPFGIYRKEGVNSGWSWIYESSGDTDGSQIFLHQKSRGTLAASMGASSGDLIYDSRFQAFEGAPFSGTFKDAAFIKVGVLDSVTSSNSAGYMSFGLTGTGSTTPSERLRIEAAQTTLSTPLTTQGRITLSNNIGITNPNTFGRDATYGMYHYVSEGITDDYAMFSAAGNYIMHVPAGTETMVFEGGIKNSTLTTSQLVATDASKNLVSVTALPSGTTVTDEVYGSGWNGSLEPPTKNAVYDKIESMGVLTMAAGTYTPTYTYTANLTSSLTYPVHYTRIGNEVTVTGYVTPLVTTSGVECDLRISLPIASNLSNEYDAAGVFMHSAQYNSSMQLEANGATDTVRLRWIQTGSGSSRVGFTFKYIVQ